MEMINPLPGFPPTWRLPFRRDVRSSFAAVATIAILASTISRGASANADVVDFNRDIKPILSENCFQCHGPDKEGREAELRLDERAGAIAELPSGSHAIVPGNLANSELVARITAADLDTRMPPAETGKTLSPRQIELLRTWIADGAKWSTHWSYQPPRRPALPEISQKSWPKNEIDFFILSRLDAEKLTPSPEADRYTLIRRLYLDLHGLPPTVAEVDAFVNDERPNAYEMLVDQLLSSPRYGERQAVRWLDLARFADTDGPDIDDPREMSPYRDWVIDSFNRDLPYDQFTIEQLAGDLLPNATVDQKVATGFNRNTTINREGGVVIEQFRVAAVADRVNTTMTVWMGATMGCAQCHSHKYDPFTHEEYYKLFAFFNNTEDEVVPGKFQYERVFVGPSISLATPEQQREIEVIDGQLAKLRGQFNQRKNALENELRGSESLARIAGIVGWPFAVRTDEQRVVLEKEVFAQDPSLSELSKQIEELEATRPNVLTSLVMVERKAPRSTHLLVRGVYDQPGQEVSPDVPEVWHSWPSGEPTNRLGLAHWLVDPANPLMSRVTVNRVWAQYFGRGLVETLEDFGSQGSLPTHPELLDYLATEFQRRGWSQKWLHRQIVTSATYRQSSRLTPEMTERDPLNLLCSRMSPLRLEAELLRDNALSISGLLNTQMGGQSVFLDRAAEQLDLNRQTSSGIGQFRRGLYGFVKRTQPSPLPLIFDANSRDVCVVNRPRTNTPLQSLALLNEPINVANSIALARRVLVERPDDAVARARFGFRLCVAREPNEEELRELLDLHERSLRHYQADHGAAQKSSHSDLLPAAAGTLNAADVAAWAVVTNVLLNLDETITRY